MTEDRGLYRFDPSEELLAELRQLDDLRRNTRDFLLAGGLLAGHADGELIPAEIARLVAALAPLYDDPDAEIAGLESPETAVEMLKTSMVWLKEHGGKRRFELYRHLAGIVAADGVIDPGESAYMQNVARGLGIPLDVAREMISWALDAAAD